MKCKRLMVGSGTDTYDPICDLPEGHRGPCHSSDAIDQYKLPSTCFTCREFRGLTYHIAYVAENGVAVWWPACWRHRGLL